MSRKKIRDEFLELDNKVLRLLSFEMISLATDLALQQLLMEDVDCIVLFLDVFIMDQALEGLAAAGLNFSRDAIAAGFAEFINGTLEIYPDMRLSCICLASSDLQWVSSMLNACPLRVFNTNFEEDFAIVELHDIHLYVEALAHHPTLEQVGLRIEDEDFPDGTLQLILSVIPNIAHLAHFSLTLEHPMIVSSANDLRRVLNILSMPSLTSVDLQDIYFETPEAVSVFTAALSRSLVTKITAGDWYFPEGMERVVANALTGDHVTEVHLEALPFVPGQKASFFEELGSALVRPPANLEELTVRGTFQPTENDIVIAFLERAAGWNLQTLRMHLPSWNATMENAVARYLNQSTRVEQLSFWIPDSPENTTGVGVYSEAILQAVDSPTCNLRSLYLAKSGGENNELMQKKLTYIFSFHAHRRELDRRFQRIHSAQQLVQALGKVDDKFLFELLRRNQWDLQKCIVQFGKGEHASTTGSD